VLQHYVHFHLIAVAAMEKLHKFFGPGELPRDLADRRSVADPPLLSCAI
jgi:hypothetical protein